MDRSFLSRSQVIAASRAFICVRLATYEDPLEAKLLKGIARTGSGELENTVFCLLDPDGKTKLVRGARGIHQVYANARAMADGLDRVAAKYTPKSSPAALPVVANARLAIDIAAADNQPLVAIVGTDKTARNLLASQVARLAWSDEFVGRFVYAKAQPGELKSVGGLQIRSGIAVIAPDKFGLKGTVLKQIEASAPAARIATTLRQALAAFKPESKSFQSQVRDGHRAGIFWQTQIPVTDPMERAARERGRHGK